MTDAVPDVHVVIAESRAMIDAGTLPARTYIPGRLTWVRCTCGWESDSTRADPYTEGTAHGLRMLSP